MNALHTLSLIRVITWFQVYRLKICDLFAKLLIIQYQKKKILKYRLLPQWKKITINDSKKQMDFVDLKRKK